MPRVERGHESREGIGQGPPWSRYWSRWRLKGMPTIRSSSSLSSRTVMSLRQLVTRNTSPVSSSSTLMVKTSGVKSSARLTACGSPPRLPPRGRPEGCAGRGCGPAELAARLPRRPAAGSRRGAPPADPAARAPPPPAASAAARRILPAPRAGRASPPPPPPPRAPGDGRAPAGADGPRGYGRRSPPRTWGTVLNEGKGHRRFLKPSRGLLRPIQRRRRGAARPRRPSCGHVPSSSQR